MRELTLDELKLVAGGEDTGDIVVVGDYGDFGDWGDFGEFGDNGDSGGGGWCRLRPSRTAPPPTFDDKDCANNSLQSQVDSSSDANSREHLGIVYQDATGIHTSPIFTGTSQGVQISQITDWMRANGVSFSSVTSLFHNHDRNEYASSDDEAAVNRYLSTNDWNTADYFVNHGADASNFTMALEDTDHVMRDFQYSDQAQTRNLTNQ